MDCMTIRNSGFPLLSCCVLLGLLLMSLMSSTNTTANHRHRHGDILRRVNRESAPRVDPVIHQWNGNARNIEQRHKVEDSIDLRSNGENEHKPSFTFCNTYRPEVYENQPINTSVIQVNATDPDPENAGGKLTYSIVETTDDFTVDVHSGLVRTNKIFDRDEPAREKIAYVSVRATDNGRPQLDDVCNLKVRIVDVNDNKPMFDKFDYRESIPRDIGVGQVVMRISATDIDDGNNGSVLYRLERFPGYPGDLEYFEVTPETGEVKLKQKFPDSVSAERQYFLTAVASDRGNPPESSSTNLSIRVIEPNQKPPYFLTEFNQPIRIKELSHDTSKPVVTLEASSGIANNTIVFFELVNGQTQATNKDSMFTSEASGNRVYIKVEKQLDYELVNEYTLSIRVYNKHDLAATTVVKIEVEDENDERPFFTDVKQGSVLENEPAGTVVMRVQAIDKDGTSPNNQVSYSLGKEYSGDFFIDSYTGQIKTNRPFDREAQDIYQLEVIAMDGAPAASVLKSNSQGLPNERREQFKIEIADKNDNPPKFDESRGGYRAEISEDADIGNPVIEVKATDPDTESVITYSIEAGDPDGHFSILSSSQGGKISVKRPLDYEKVQSYNLRVKASDSLREVFTTVLITVLNVNDNPPVFDDLIKKVTIWEESVPQQCIFTVRAFDPDIGNRTLPQNIIYFVDKKVQDSFSVDSQSGCVRVKKPLDRDPPNGIPFVQAYIGAYDENGNTSTRIFSHIELIVNLTDINDNAPFLNSTNPVVWDENMPMGTVTYLTALDYDEEQNGPPFAFRIPLNASPEIRGSFEIINNVLKTTKDNFDREAQKSYSVPIQITDSGKPPQTGTSILTVIIGDKNDNTMYYGESNIFVYKYKEKSIQTIGRVYVNDADDWDLPDKTFAWDGPGHSDFVLDYVDGSIRMRPSVTDGVHTLKFKVSDTARDEHVTALVNVTVRAITDEAIDSSGSIRFYGISKEDFIKPEADGKSKKDKLRTEIANILMIPEANVDVFTVMNPYASNDEKVVDVRFAAHNSPYYKSEKMEGILAPHKDRLESLLKVNILMIRVDECIRENVNCEQSCVNRLTKNPNSYVIFTNTSSFVGVDAYVTPECTCVADVKPKSCQPNPCLHGGVCHAGGNIDGFICECFGGRLGARCEQTSLSFHGTGYAWFSPLTVCTDSVLSLHFTTTASDGLIIYNGPTYKVSNNVTDFMSLELRSGRPVFLMDYGSGVLLLEFSESSAKLSDGKEHFISLKWTPTEISMTLDDCARKDAACHAFGSAVGSHSYLNVNGPLQVGGISFNPKELQSHMNWNHIPTSKGFSGCISNLTINGQYYDLGEPSFSIGNLTNCDVPVAGVQVANLGVGLNFIIILIVCILVLLILVLAVVFYRRSRKYEEVKGEPGDDVRENIINYSDEGGGEGDHAGYDLSVLMKAGNIPYHSTPDKIPMDHFNPSGQIPLDERPDIGTFLKGNKNRVDGDPEGLPPDDVRNYAYEGDGNSLGSLSSLASGTDDEDTNFEEFLPGFGPRFKKLADMYGGESSDEDRSVRASDAWC